MKWFRVNKQEGSDRIRVQSIRLRTIHSIGPVGEGEDGEVRWEIVEEPVEEDEEGAPENLDVDMDAAPNQGNGELVHVDAEEPPANEDIEMAPGPSAAEADREPSPVAVDEKEKEDSSSSEDSDESSSKDEDDNEDEDSKEEFVVEKILGKTMYRGVAQYWIKWEGYPEADNTWEPIYNLVNAMGKVRKFDEMDYLEKEKARLKELAARKAKRKAEKALEKKKRKKE